MVADTDRLKSDPSPPKTANLDSFVIQEAIVLAEYYFPNGHDCITFGKKYLQCKIPIHLVPSYESSTPRDLEALRQEKLGGIDTERVNLWTRSLNPKDAIPEKPSPWLACLICYAGSIEVEAQALKLEKWARSQAAKRLEVAV